MYTKKSVCVRGKRRTHAAQEFGFEPVPPQLRIDAIDLEEGRFI